MFSLLANDPGLAPMLEDVQRKITAVVERIASGDHTGATEQFVETVALGPGAWKTLPPDIQQRMIENAPTFLDEANDPEQLAFDLEWISGFPKPVLFTLGDQSPPTFAPVVMRLSGALPHAGGPHIARRWTRSARNTSGCLCRGDHRVHASAFRITRGCTRRASRAIASRSSALEFGHFLAPEEPNVYSNE